MSIIDCKSVYDHASGAGSAGVIGDKRVAVDMIIVKESLLRCSSTLRWAPGPRQLADCLTKDKAEPTDLLRAVLKSGIYQLADEPAVLERALIERERRKEKGRARAALAGTAPAEDREQSEDVLVCHCGCSGK